MRGIYWLASYPKSGNTWTRAFLSNLTSETKEPANINDLATGAIGSSREWVQEALGIEISELTHAEIDQLRPKAYQWIADNFSTSSASNSTGNSETGFHKVHDAYTYLENGEALIPKTAIRGAVYLVRNPMDVAVSLANHSNIDIQTAVDHVCDPDMAFCHSDRRLPAQLRQILKSWSEHVDSWLTADIPKLVCRYEDIQLNPKRLFTEVANFLEIETSPERIDQAIAASSFDNLRAQEDQQGFDEKSPEVAYFFRKGIVGDWRNQLSDQQVSQIVKANKDVMRQLGYMDSDGNITALALGESARVEN